MADTTNLRWEAEVQSSATSWLYIRTGSTSWSNSITGEGSMNVSVSAKSSTQSSTETGRITFRCLDCDSIVSPITVTVKRCPPECTCDDLIVVGKSIDSSSGTNITIGTYETGSCITNITAETDADWIENIEVKNNGDIVGKVSENTESDARTATITVTGKAGENNCEKTFTLTQSGKTCEPSTCYKVTEATATGVTPTATTTAVTWQYSAITIDENCVENLVTGSTSAEVSINPVADCNELEETGNFTWEGHTECGGSSDITINWTVTKNKPDWCDCACNALNLSEESVNISIGAETAVGYNIDSTCVNENTIIVSSNNETITTGTCDTANNQIKINGLSSGEATITVKYKSGNIDCEKNISVNVNCPTYIITANTQTPLTCEGGDVTFSVQINN